jgi:hypothetical protein
MRRGQRASAAHLAEGAVEAAAGAATNGHPVIVGLAIVAYAAVFGKEDVNYALRNCFGVVTYEKPL